MPPKNRNQSQTNSRGNNRSGKNQQNPVSPPANQNVTASTVNTAGITEDVIQPAPQSAYDKTGTHLPPITTNAVPNHNAAPPTPTSPTNCSTSLPPDGPALKDKQAVTELLDTMKSTVGAVGATLDVLGNQTIKIASLVPAIDANNQISTVTKQVSDHYAKQEKKMEEVKDLFKKELNNTQLQERLKQVALVYAQEVIRREIAERVRKELEQQVTQDMREQVAQYQRRILEIRTLLENSEARRHNALIRSNNLEEPLKPLLRPLPPSPTLADLPSTPSSGKTIVNDLISPPNQPLPKTTRPNDRTQQKAQQRNSIPPKPELAELVIENNPRTMIREMNLVPPTPSPLFPRNLSSLMKMGVDDAKALVSEYGLHSGSPPAASARESGQESREEILNRFMSHIGVGFQLVPGPTSPGAKNTPQSPTHIMTRT
ncbi:hypothetical protein C8Q75DRAFT_811231 [Abortiporus biennis]|nr:hypothetical protein C8Q75DRAFT_811231 [Abortiporus biennis]